MEKGKLKLGINGGRRSVGAWFGHLQGDFAVASFGVQSKT